MIVLIGTQQEVLATLLQLQGRGIDIQVSTTVADAPVVEPAKPEQQQEQPANLEAPKKKKEVTNYYKDGSPYKEIVDLYNGICTKLARRKEFVNYQLKKQLDKLITGQSAYSMDEIRQAFQNIQDGEWFDDPYNRNYGNFLWVIQRSKIENALRGSYVRNFNKDKQNKSCNHGAENQRDNRQQLGGAGIATRGFDY